MWIKLSFSCTWLLSSRETWQWCWHYCAAAVRNILSSFCYWHAVNPSGGTVQLEIFCDLPSLQRIKVTLRMLFYDSCPWVHLISVKPPMGMCWKLSIRKVEEFCAFVYKKMWIDITIPLIVIVTERTWGEIGGACRGLLLSTIASCLLCTSTRHTVHVFIFTPHLPLLLYIFCIAKLV